MRCKIKLESGAPQAVTATLSGERHDLGLQMAALVLGRHGVRAHMLGTDTPPDEIVRAVKASRAVGVGISVSLATGGVATDRALAELRQALSGRVRLLVGGRGARGARRGVPGAEYFSDLEELGAWLAKGPFRI